MPAWRYTVPVLLATLLLSSTSSVAASVTGVAEMFH